MAYWPRAYRSSKVFLGTQIGDGLGNSGDHLLLKDKSGQVIDAVGWGDDTVVWDPAANIVPVGSSLGRFNSDNDSNQAEDFGEQMPSPGR